MELEDALGRLARGEASIDETLRWIRVNAVAQVGAGLTLDLGRRGRTGVPEVVLGEGKSAEDVVAAARGLLDASGLAVVTRCDPDVAFDGLDAEVVRHECGVVVLRRGDGRAGAPKGTVALLTAGAVDARVADEARVVAEALGCRVVEARDVGVASLARAVDAVRRLMVEDPDVWVVVAGREGALAPVVAGLVPGPVIGVPVGSGYGHGGRGEAALSTMLQSCTTLLTVNIDAGFVAGAAAAQFVGRLASP